MFTASKPSRSPDLLRTCDSEDRSSTSRTDYAYRDSVAVRD